MRGKMIKAILFDLDGVLCDACEWHYEALNIALGVIAGTQIYREEHETIYNGLPTKEKLAILVRNGRIDKDQAEKIERKKQIYTKLAILMKAKKDQDKIAMLQTLKMINDLKIACITNSIRSTATLMLRKTGQLQFLDYLVTNQDVAKPKPDPEGYLKAVRYFNLDPYECLIVEDSAKGIEAAYLSGCHVLEVKNPAEVTHENVIKRVQEIDAEYIAAHSGSGTEI